MSLVEFSQFVDLVIQDIQSSSLFDKLFWISASLSPILLSILKLGFILNKKTTEKITDLPSVSVVVSARNEEQDLPECVESLLDLDYPKEKLQIILVNDKSDDNTGDLIDAYDKDNAIVLAVHTEDMSNTHLEAKARGIAWGIEHATGEWIFITDADGVVNSKWLKHSFSVIDEKTGMIGGALAVEPKGFQGKLERMTWAFVQMFNLGMSGWGIPFACVGPNMAIRKDIYDRAGGLETAEFCIAEDLALLNMVQKSEFKIVTPVSEETTIKLKQVPSFKHYLSQLRRWFRGGIENGSDYRWILYVSFWWGLTVMSYQLIGWVISFPVYLSILFFQIISDLLILVIQKYKLGLKNHVRYLPYLILAKFIAFSYIPLSFIFTRKIEWMGDGYQVNYD